MLGMYTSGKPYYCDLVQKEEVNFDFGVFAYLANIPTHITDPPGGSIASYIYWSELNTLFQTQHYDSIT